MISDLTVENSLSVVTNQSSVSITDPAPQVLQVTLSRPLSRPRCLPHDVNHTSLNRVFVGDTVTLHARVSIGYAVTFQWLMTNSGDVIVEFACAEASCRSSRLVRG